MDHSPLGMLPIELRLDIYERALFVDSGVKVTLNQPQSKKRRLSMEKYASQPHLLALQSTCKEIASEMAGMVFKINTSWIFVQMDDDSTSWGKRLQKWSQQAGKSCLERAQSVQYGIGGWCSGTGCYPRGGIKTSLFSAIGSMYQNLPKQLRRCEQSFTFRLNWDCAGPRSRQEGGTDRLTRLTFSVPIWTAAEKIEEAFRTGYDYDDFLAEYYSWYWDAADGAVPGCSTPPEYDVDPEIHANIEMSRFHRLAFEIEAASCSIFVKDTQRRLEVFAVDQ